MPSEFHGDSESVKGIDGNIVIRKAHYWSTAVRDLLLWLEKSGFPYSSIPEVPNRKCRVQIFLEAYGTDWTDNIADEVARIQRRDINRVKYLADQGLEPQKSWANSDFMDEPEQRVVWTERNKNLLTHLTQQHPPSAAPAPSCWPVVP